jgi:hypothetical protein
MLRSPVGGRTRDDGRGESPARLHFSYISVRVRFWKSDRASSKWLRIGEPLPGNSLERRRGSRLIVKARRFALVVPEVVFRQIPVQVMLAAMLVDALEAALEDAEITLQRVRVGVAPDVLFRRVIDRLVTGKRLADEGGRSGR